MVRRTDRDVAEATAAQCCQKVIHLEGMFFTTAPCLAAQSLIDVGIHCTLGMIKKFGKSVVLLRGRISDA